MSSVPLQAVPFPDNTQFNDVSLNIKTAIYDKNDTKQVYDHKGSYLISSSSYYDNATMPFNAFNGSSKTYWKCNTIQNDFQFSPIVKPYTQTPYIISSSLISPSIYQGGGSQSANYFTTTVSSSAETPQQIDGEWLQIQLPVQFTLSQYTLLTPPPQGSINYFPLGWTVAGSQDGNKWYFIDQKDLKKSPNVSDGKAVPFALTSNASYSYFRLIITKMPPRTDIVRISQWNLFGMPAKTKESFVGMLNPQFSPANSLFPSLNTFSSFSISEPMTGRCGEGHHNAGSHRSYVGGETSGGGYYNYLPLVGTEVLLYDGIPVVVKDEDNTWETIFVTALFTILVGTSVYIMINK
jgi:hypothetical protein